MNLVRRRNAHARGSALIVVIWTLGILTVFTVSLNRSASQELLLGRWMKEKVLTRSLARAGVERAVSEIQKDKFLTFDAPNQTWGRNEDAFRHIRLGVGSFFVFCPTDPAPGGSVFDLGSEGYYGVCDEASRVNVNTAPEEVLRDLVLAVMEPEDEDGDRALTIARSILDWRDSDDTAQEEGAEQDYYEHLPDPYLVPNRKIETIEELAMVRGMTEELMDRLRPYVTVYTEGAVNMNTASTMVMKALGFDDDLITKIWNYRRGDDETLGTEDDRVFQSAATLTADLSTVESLSVDELDALNRALGFGILGVKSDVFRIYATGRLFIRRDKTSDNIISCVVKRNGIVLDWNEGNR